MRSTELQDDLFILKEKKKNTDVHFNKSFTQTATEGCSG